MSQEHKHCKIVGPFKEPEWYYASVDGYLVPYIKLRKLSGNEDGKVEIHLDACCWIIDESEVDVVIHLVAKAMAVAAGYNNIGEQSEKFNPFKTKLVEISNINP